MKTLLSVVTFLLLSVAKISNAFSIQKFSLSLLKKSAPMILGVGLFQLTPPVFLPDSFVVHADSTGVLNPPTFPFLPVPSILIMHACEGKFSSKMTAKKRYLPRVISGKSSHSSYSVVLFCTLLTHTSSTGTKNFNSIIASDQGIDDFVSSDLEGFLRAMDLYGASLRKGEVPDETSRTATKLTKTFEEAMKKTQNSKTEQNKSDARSALDAYLKFAKLSPSNSPKPAEPL
jgi:hypothetical protein